MVLAYRTLGNVSEKGGERCEMMLLLLSRSSALPPALANHFGLLVLAKLQLLYGTRS